MRRGIAAAVALVIASAATEAPAAPRVQWKVDKDDRASAAMTAAARARFAEAVQLYGKKKYDKALAAFVQAYALTGNPSVLINLGLTSLKMNDPLRAAYYFSQYLRDVPDAPSDTKRRALNGLAEARKSLGSVDVVAPEGAEVSVDGESVGRAPLATAVDVLPGHHTVSVKTSSGSKSEEIDAAAGATVKVRLGAAGPAEPPPNASSERDLGTETPAETATPAAPTPPPAPERPGTFTPPDSMVPVYAAGVVGLGLLTGAIVLRGIGANADRNVSVANDALTRAGKDPSACNTTDVDITLANTCSHLASAERAQNDVKVPFVIALSGGIIATSFALGWYFFGDKTDPAAEKREKKVMRASPVPWGVSPEIGPRGEPGATMRLSF